MSTQNIPIFDDQIQQVVGDPIVKGILKSLDYKPNLDFEDNQEVNYFDLGTIRIAFGRIAIQAAGGTKSISFGFTFGNVPIVVANIHDSDISAQEARSFHTSTIAANSFIIQSRDIIDTGVGTTDVTDNEDDTNSFIYWIAIGQKP